MAIEQAEQSAAFAHAPERVAEKILAMVESGEAQGIGCRVPMEERMMSHNRPAEPGIQAIWLARGAISGFITSAEKT